MAAVNGDFAGPPDHLAYLLHVATRRLRTEAEVAARPGVPLQAAQARLLDLIPPGGGRVSDLATVMRISKQGLGQLATQLAEMGYIEIVPDPADKRAKLVCCTPLGADIRHAMRATIAQVQQRWRHEIGPERYATFHEVLRDLVHGGVEAPAQRQSSQYTYEWLTVDPVAAGVSVPEQPPLPSIIEPTTMPPVDGPVDGPVDEPLIPVVDRGIQLPAPYWHVGWPAAVTGTFLRAEAARRLVTVAAGLPEPFGLAVLDGWRPLELQRQIYRAAYQDPALPPGFVSEPSTDPRTPPPHLTGGAVDITLTYRHRALALGTEFDAFTAQAASAAFETVPGVVRELRRLLTARMLEAGFVGYQQEWWHFEYGTRRWAAVRDERPHYGPASPPQAC